jgi:hypothetical protein
MKLVGKTLVVTKVANGYTVTSILNAGDHVMIFDSLGDALNYIAEFYRKNFK